MHRASFSKASQGDYIAVYSAAEIRAIFGEYDKSKLHVSVTNGDGDAVATHFYSPECWSSGVYAYFYPSLNNGVSVRVNVDMTYRL